jgi:alpha-L-rhamnosidase
MRKLLTVLLLTTSCRVCFSQNNTGSNTPVFQSSYIEPTRIVKLAEGHYFIDFGTDAFGTLSLFLISSQTDSFTVHLGEKLNNDGTIDRNPGGSIRYQKITLAGIPLHQTYLLQLPAGRNTHPPSIALPDSFGVVLPFRYCEIENLKVPIKDIKISQKVYHYHFNDTASAFTSSDTILNQVWELCKHTIKGTSFTGLYIDGDRERTPYEADAYINQLSHYSVDNDYSMAERTNEYFIDHPTWPTEWILQTASLFYNDYLYTGNSAPLLKNYEALKSKTLVELEREDGLISVSPSQKMRDIVDWPAGERDGYEMVNINTVVNAFHYSNLKLMAEIAGILRKVDDSVYFSRQSVLVKNSINLKLFDKEKGIYVDGEGSGHSSLHANLFALVFDLVPEEHLKSVISFIKTRGMVCSVYGAQYLLEGLYKNGEGDYGLQLMTATNDRSWWNMIKTGATMTMEAWDMKYKPNSDWNHPWGTAPANIVTRYMWGITPARPGFTKVNIRPQLASLTFSTIKAPTMNGPIRAEYKQINKKRKLFIIELPPGMDGDLIFKQRSFTLKPGVNRIDIKD